MEIVQVYLKINDDFFEKYKGNQYNTLSPEMLRDMLASPQKCYFQKYSPNEKGSRHRIIVPFSAERAIEIVVFLNSVKIDDFTQKYFYKVQKIKEISFFNHPKNDTVEQLVFFTLIAYSDKDGSEKKDFQDLYKSVEKNSIPQVDVQKEKDIAIWTKYVLSLIHI